MNCSTPLARKGGHRSPRTPTGARLSAERGESVERSSSVHTYLQDPRWKFRVARKSTPDGNLDGASGEVGQRITRSRNEIDSRQET